MPEPGGTGAKQKWFQVSCDPAKLATGMHGTELRSRKNRTIARLLPAARFRTAAQRSRVRLPVLSAWGRLLETAFRSTATTACLQAPIPASTLPTCFFAASPEPPQTRSAFDSPTPAAFAGWGGITAAGPLPDSFPASPGIAPDLHSPSGVSVPSGSERSTRFLPESPPPRAARSPFAPRNRLYWNSPDSGSTFQARYVPGGLLSLKPLGTFLMMHRAGNPVKFFFRVSGCFPQERFGVFCYGYVTMPVERL